MSRPTFCLMACVMSVIAADTAWSLQAFQRLSRGKAIGTDVAVTPTQSSGWRPEGTASGPAAVVQLDTLTPLPDEEEPDLDNEIKYFPEVLVSDAQQAGADSEISIEEEEIWRDQLSGLTPEEADEVLEIRSRIGSLADFPSSEALGSEPAPLPLSEIAVHDARPIPTAIGSADVLLASAVSESPVLTRLREHANAVYRQNLANRMTPGFKRREILIVAAVGNSEPDTSPETADRETPTWLTRLDLTPGKLRATGNPLDVAISGRGWFKVANETIEGFTRCGVLGVTDDGKLGVWSGAGLLPLSPEVVVPADEFTILSNGTIASVQDPGNVDSRPQIVLHTFLNPSALEHTSVGLYAASDASGPAKQRDVALPVQFVVESLEESNSQDGERAEMERLLNLVASQDSADQTGSNAMAYSPEWHDRYGAK